MHLNLSALITIAGGIYAVLAAFGVIPVSKNPDANEAWLRKFGTMLKVLGPVLIVFGLAELFGLFA